MQEGATGGYSHEEKDWINKGHYIHSNVIISDGRTPGVVFNVPLKGNKVVNNFFVGCPENQQIVNGEGSALFGNVSIPD